MSFHRSQFKFLVLFSALLFSSQSFAVKLSDYTPYKYEVLFTNPICKQYEYSQTVYNNKGELLRGPKKNAYCTGADKAVSANRKDAPQYRILEWINDPSTKEIFFTFLSLSNWDVGNAICDAVRTRGLKVRFLIDSTSDTTLADEITDQKCAPSGKQISDYVSWSTRGHTGPSHDEIGYAHNKLIMINPRSTSEVKIAFGSGNMSGGTVLHHENWHFITTNPKSHFAQAHQCMIGGMENAAGSISEYRNYMNKCRKSITASEESDIQVFFSPAEGWKAYNALESALNDAFYVEMAAHRLTYGRLVSDLQWHLNSGKKLRLLVDDDIYWLAKTGAQVGDNLQFEAGNVRSIENAGGAVRYVQTNHHDHKLHHNKYMIFYKNFKAFAVFAGAGNFTGTAFSSNFENFYFITNPSIVESFSKQYQHMWDDISTTEEDMPTQDVLVK